MGDDHSARDGAQNPRKGHVWRRGDAGFGQNTRPSLSPIKRKLPEKAGGKPAAAAPAAEEKTAPAMASIAAAAGRGWGTPAAQTENPAAPEPPADAPYIVEAASASPGPDDSDAAAASLALGDAPLADPPPPEEEAALKKACKNRRIRILIPVFAIVLVVSLWQIFSIQTEYSEAVNEYDSLRQQAFPTRMAPTASGAQPQEEEPAVFDLAAVQAQNPGCVGWMEIPGTNLSYPLVRGSDNDKYLNHTFLGTQNSAGAIFIDYRSPADLLGQHLIFYGHNMKNGSMFGLLPKYLDAAFLEANATLLIYNESQVFTYRIFSARVTDAYDPSYQLDFASPEAFSAFAETCGAPASTSQMLTMSTCTNVNDDERILVHAYLVSATAALHLLPNLDK